LVWELVSTHPYSLEWEGKEDNFHLPGAVVRGERRSLKLVDFGMQRFKLGIDL
jgi:hypothetical protein